MRDICANILTTKTANSSESARLAALQDYRILDTAAEKSFDRISRAAADVCEAPMALISLVDDQRQWFKSNIGVPATETPRDISFCTHAIEHDGLMIVPDATNDPRFANNPLVTGALHIRFYAGAPLCSPDGHRLGTLCVIDRAARSAGLTGIQSRMLETLAAQVVTQLELRRTVAELEWSAHHDPLTGLPNRVLFQHCLDKALTTASTQRTYRVGVALLDLDHFKQVNDVYGHDAGDALLRHVATILRDFTRPGDTAARLGGDEFILVLPDCGSEAVLTRRIDGLLERLRQPYLFEGHRLDGRASIGMACSPGQGRDAGTLLKHADIAMYRAKSAGRGLAWMFRYDLGADVARRVDTGNAIRTAIHDGDVFPYYQPQFSLETGAIVGCEALVRYRRDGKIYLPNELEEVFEDRELGVGLGACMIKQVISDMRSWRNAGIGFGPVSINASAVELRRPDYARHLFRALADANLSASGLHVEVTEGVFVGRGSERIEETLRALSAGGVSIALDDFGTGFASLSHLKKFRVDVIKIDRSFVESLEKNKVDVAIITAVIKLAANLSMKIIAEGVETARQAQILRSIGCDVVQGFYFARPMTAEKFASTWKILDAARNRTADKNNSRRFPSPGQFSPLLSLGIS